jgi:hypothetical protein
MPSVYAILASVFLLASALPSVAANDTTVPGAASDKAQQLPPSTDSAKSDANAKKGVPAAKDGTPAVVVDDNTVQNLLGRAVNSSAGEKLGQITDVIVGRGGDIRAAVIDFGGFLGVGSRKVAVAWSALKFLPGSIVVDMTRDELRVTPEYRPDEPIVIVGPQHAQTSPSPAPAPKAPAAK